MADVPFGPWRPDMGAFDTGAGEARNCIRVTDGYRPLASLADFNAGAIGSWPSYLSTVRGNDSVMQVISGCTNKLYKLDASTMGWTNVSRPGGYATATNRWRGVQWGDELVLTNGIDNMQVTALSSGLPFADLVDANDTTQYAPRAKYIAACGPYLVVGNTWDILDGDVPNRLRWCGIEDIRAWLPSAETTSDWQDQPDVGPLRGLTGGRQLTCLFEDGMVVGSLIGAPKAFRFDRVEGAQGCLEPNSVIQFRANTFYLSRDGFQRWDGRQSTPIGWRKVNRWFFKDAFFDKLSRMSCTVDTQQKVIMWLFCGSGGDGVTPNHMMVYNYDDDDFTWAEVDAQLLGSFTTPGYNIDNIDGLSPDGSIDLLPAPLDDPFYAGGVPITGAFKDYKLYSLAGNPMTAVLDTPFVRIGGDGRTMVTEVRDVIEGQGSVLCQVSTMDEVQRNAKRGPITPENRFGFFPVRAEGSWHKVRLYISNQWTGAYGVKLTPRPSGGR